MCILTKFFAIHMNINICFAVALSNLGQPENAQRAYEQAMSLSPYVWLMVISVLNEKCNRKVFDNCVLHVLFLHIWCFLYCCAKTNLPSPGNACLCP